jgi:hypothetical protein
MANERSYQDTADIVARKAKGRRQQARLSFAEKLAILDKLREAAAAFAQARTARRRA